MPCIPAPALPTPPFPAGFSFAAPPPPSIDLDVNICCKQIAFSYTPKIPLPSATINVALLVAVNAAAEALRVWLASLPLKCPREPE